MSKRLRVGHLALVVVLLISVVPCPVVAQTAAPASGAAPGHAPTVREGRRYRIVCDFAAGKLADAALATAEATGSAAEKLFGAAVPGGAALLDINIYRETRAYEEVEERLTHGAFKANGAFTHFASKAAYIAIRPPCADGALAAVGLPRLTQTLVANEAANLARVRCFNTVADHPRWLATGAEMYLTEQALAQTNMLADVRTDAFFSTAAVDVARMARDCRLPSFARALRDEGFPEGTPRYDLSWALFRFLAMPPRRAALDRILKEARRLGGGSGYVEELAQAFEREMGRDAMKSLDAAFRDYAASLCGDWDELYRSLDTRGAEWNQMAFQETNAVAWRTPPVGKDTWTLAGEFQIFEGTSRQLNVLIDRQREGFLQVCFAATTGVTVFRVVTEGGQWLRLANAAVPGIATDGWHAFEVAAKGSRLTVSVDGHEALTTTAKGSSLAGPWGLGALAGTAGRWRSVALKP